MFIRSVNHLTAHTSGGHLRKCKYKSVLLLKTNYNCAERVRIRLEVRGKVGVRVGLGVRGKVGVRGGVGVRDYGWVYG